MKKVHFQIFSTKDDVSYFKFMENLKRLYNIEQITKNSLGHVMSFMSLLTNLSETIINNKHIW